MCVWHAFDMPYAFCMDRAGPCAGEETRQQELDVGIGQVEATVSELGDVELHT